MAKSARNRGADRSAGAPATQSPAPGAPGPRVPPAIRALGVLAGAGVVGVLLVASALYRYPHALADDYSRASRVRQYGPLGATAWEYRNWSGRWSGIGTSCLLWSALDLSNPWTYRVTLVVLAGLCAAAIHFFLCSVLEWRFLAPRSIALTLTFVAVYWTGMLAPGEGLCWLSAALEYQLGSAAILFVAAGLIRLGRLGAGARRGWIAGLVVAAAVLPGMHELLGLILCMVLGLGTLIALWRRLPSRWAWLAVAAAAMVGMAFVAIAPGNSVRRAQFPRSLDFAWAWSFLISHARDFLPIWFGDGRLWAATFLFWLAADSVGLHPLWLATKGIAWVLWIPLAWAGALAAMFFVPAYATGDHLPFRAYNGAYLCFLVGWFLTVLAVRERLAAAGPAAPRSPAWTWGPAVWLAAVFFLYLLWAHVPGDDLPNLPRKNGDLIFLGFGLAYLAALLAWVVGARNSRTSSGRGVLWAVLLVALPTTLLWTGNVPLAFEDLTAKQVLVQSGPRQAPVQVAKTRLEWFDLQMRDRTDYIRQQAAAGRRTVMVPPILHWPKTFFRSDLSGDPDYWANRELCPYFGIDLIVVGPRFDAR